MVSVKLMCIFCQLVMSKSNLSRHVKRKHAGPKGTLKCPICSKKKTSYFSMVDHIKSKHGIETLGKHRPNLMCNDCDIAFNSSIILSEHMREYHRQINCMYCGLKYNASRSLRRHIKEKHPKGERSVFVCLDCGWTDRIYATYVKHREECLGPVCGICGRVFKKKDTLYRHFRSKHPGYVLDARETMRRCRPRSDRAQTQSRPVALETESNQGESDIHK